MSEANANSRKDRLLRSSAPPARAFRCEIADALGYPRETLRRYRAFDRGEMIWHEQIERRVSRAGPPLPRVYGPGEDEPNHTWVNLPLTALARPREVLLVEQRAWTKLKQLDDAQGWAAGSDRT